MAWIKKQGHKETKVPYKHDNQAREYYSSTAWQKLRKAYIIENPLCERCLQEGKTEPAAEVHHRRPFLQGKDYELRWDLFLDWRNLMSVCSKCHHELHRQFQKETKDNK